MNQFIDIDSEDSQEELDWQQEGIEAINGQSGRNRKPHTFFKSYRHLLNNLILIKNVRTMYAIVNMAISFDSKVCITVT